MSTLPMNQSKLGYILSTCQHSSSVLVLFSRWGGAFSLKDAIKNKLHRLMLPYLLWALLYAKFSVPNFLKILYGSYWSIASSGASSNLWFLPVMFMALVLFYLYVKTGFANSILNNSLVMVASFLIGYTLPHLKIGYPWGVDVAFMAFAFMLLGFIIKSYIGKLHAKFKSNRGTGVIFTFMLFMVMLAGTLTYHFDDDVTIVMMKNAHYGYFGYFALSAVFGTLMLLFFSLCVELLNSHGYKWLSVIGQNTLCIFVIHKPIISFFKVLFRYVDTPEVVMLITTTIGTLLLSCFVCNVINKQLPILAGR